MLAQEHAPDSQTNHNKIKFLHVILSLSNFHRVKNEVRSEKHCVFKRDLAPNPGGLLTGCYICCGKPPKFVRRSLRRLAPWFYLTPRSVKLRQAQDDRLVACLLEIFRFDKKIAPHEAGQEKITCICLKRQDSWDF